MHGPAPKVSVVIPTYQRAQYLAGTLETLLGQTLQDIEIIVADDGSTDATPDVVARVVDPRVYYLRREHLGLPSVLNAGFEAARGEYIMTCHDHDIYEPSLLAELAGVLDRHATATYAHCGLVVVDPSGVREVDRHVPDFPEVTAGRAFLVEELLPGLDSRISAMSMVRRSALNGELYDPQFGSVCDVELWLRLSTKGDVGWVREPLIRVRQRDASSTHYHSGLQLATSVLKAKQSYLEWAGDEGRRTAIQASWRRDVDRTGFAQLLKALQYRQYQDAPAILDFVQREGNPRAAWLLALLARLPRRATLLILGAVRLMSRLMRSITRVTG